MQPKILVVEDDENLRFMIIEALALLDVDVTACSSADEAVSILENLKSFSMVMTDIRMPGNLDGWDLMHLVLNRWPNLPILVSSGYTQAAVSELPANVTLLPKPWALDTLLTTIEDVLPPRRAEDGQTQPEMSQRTGGIAAV